MNASASSVSTPLMDRTVCEECGHMHRRVLADKCPCCGSDCKQANR